MTNNQRVFSLAVRDVPSEPAAELRISGPIGETFWDDSGTSGRAFADALAAIPAGRKINLRINSEGGSVQDGLEIYNAIKARSADITAHITGYAVSIASVIPLAASKVVSPKSALWMIHKPWMVANGNADQMRKAAEMLDKHEDVLRAIYQESTGQDPEKLKKDLSDETWMTGEEAVAYGLADELTDEPVILDRIENRFGYRRAPAAMGDVPPPQRNTNNERSTMEPVTTTTPSAGAATPAEDINALKVELANARKAVEDARRERITRTVDGYIAECRIDLASRSEAIEAAVKDETVLSVFAKIPPRHPFATPARPQITGGDDALGIMSSMKTPRERFSFAKANFNDVMSAGSRRVQGANTHSGLSTLLGTMLSDGVATVLQNRCCALRAVARQFGDDRLKPLTPVIFKQVQAGGTAQTNATSFEDTTNFVGTTEPVTITPARITAGAHITAAELNSGLRIADFAEIKGAEMADAIMAKVAAVITSGNFTATPQVWAASAFGGAEMRTLWGILKKANNKSLILDGEYYAQLLPSTREEYNVEEGGSWPGWNGVFLNTYWTGATANTVGFALDPYRAIACVAGLPLLPGAAGNSPIAETTFTVPGIEIAVSQQQWVATAGKVEWINWEIMFGASKNDGTAGVLIKSS